jgi:hypothetical protein
MRVSNFGILCGAQQISFSFPLTNDHKSNGCHLVRAFLNNNENAPTRESESG